MFQKDPLTISVLKHLLSLIAGKTYPVNSRFPAERVLCKKIGVSRGTLRKAFKELKKIGMLEIRHGSGAYVKSDLCRRIPKSIRPPGMHERISLEDVILSREALEIPAMRLAARRIKPGEIKKLGTIIARMKANTGNLAAFIDADMEFHRVMVGVGRNRVLLTAFEAIYPYHKFTQVMTSYKEGELEKTVRMHESIFKALESRNAGLCRKLLKRHFADMRRYKSNVLCR